MRRKPTSPAALRSRSTAPRPAMPTRPVPGPEIDALKLRHAAVAGWCHTAGGLEEGTPELDRPRAASGSTRTGGLLPGIPADPARARRHAAGSTRSLVADGPRPGAGSLPAEGHGDRVRPDRCSD